MNSVMLEDFVRGVVDLTCAVHELVAPREEPEDCYICFTPPAEGKACDMPCRHTVCLPCMRRWTKQQATHGQAFDALVGKCPACKLLVVLPPRPETYTVADFERLDKALALVGDRLVANAKSLRASKKRYRQLTQSADSTKIQLRHIRGLRRAQLKEQRDVKVQYEAASKRLRAVGETLLAEYE